MTKWLKYLFNIWPFTNSKNLPNGIKMCQGRFNVGPHSHKKLHKGSVVITLEPLEPFIRLVTVVVLDQWSSARLN